MDGKQVISLAIATIVFAIALPIVGGSVTDITTDRDHVTQENATPTTADSYTLDTVNAAGIDSFSLYLANASSLGTGDYTFTSANGTIEFGVTGFLNCDGGGGCLVNYTAFPDGYLEDSTARDLAGKTGLFFVLAFGVALIAGMVAFAKKMSGGM